MPEQVRADLALLGANLAKRASGARTIDRQLLDKRELDPKRRTAVIPIFC